MTFLRIAPVIIAVAGCYEPPPPAPKESETPLASDKSTQPTVKAPTVPVRPPVQTVPPVQLAQPTTEFDRALARARAEGKLLFVEFSASWCGPCQQMRRTTFSDPTVRARLGQFVSFFVDADSNPNLVQRFQVKEIPAYFLVRPDPVILRSGKGYLSSTEFLRWLGR